MNFNKTIQMCIFDGNPNGQIMCELSNWNGKVYKISRNELSMFSKRDDAENTGVYFLFGKDENNSDNVYIGESERICTRLKQHLKDTTYWNECVVVISKDNLLNKAHIKFLENKFYLLAQESGRFYIVNSTIPTCSSISEYDESMLLEFISNTKLLVNTLGYKTFESIDESSILDQNSNLIFSIKTSKGANSKGYVVADGFVVLKGSIIALSTTPSIPTNIVKLRTSLLEKGIIDENNTFVTNHIFTSPSTASAIVMGRSSNGKADWKTDNGESLNDIESKL